ncbi:MAG: hypothetical protein WA720_04100 [Pseudolabrys sp.]
MTALSTVASSHCGRLALEDAGLLGVDKGLGVKFVTTPPGYTGKVPDGFEQLSTDTFTG